MVALVEWLNFAPRFGCTEPEGMRVYVLFLSLPDCCWQAFHCRPGRRPVAGSHAGADRRWRHCSGQSPRPEAVNSIKLHRFRQSYNCQSSPWHQEPPLQSRSVDPHAGSMANKVVAVQENRLPGLEAGRSLTTRKSVDSPPKRAVVQAPWPTECDHPVFHY